MRFSDLPAIERRIVGYHQDEEGHWVAELECGHGQHLRHEPPWQSRPWVVTETGRAQFLGTTLWCAKCCDPAWSIPPQPNDGSDDVAR